MVWPAVAAAAAQAYASDQERKSSNSMYTSPMGGSPAGDNRTVINVAPTASNLGDMLNGFMGDPSNGGFGAPGSRYMAASSYHPANTTAIPVKHDSGQGESVPWTLIAVGIASATVLIVILRRA